MHLRRILSSARIDAKHTEADFCDELGSELGAAILRVVERLDLQKAA